MQTEGTSARQRGHLLPPELAMGKGHVHYDKLFGRRFERIVYEPIKPWKVSVFVLVNTLLQKTTPLESNSKQLYTQAAHSKILLLLYKIIERGQCSYKQLLQLAAFADNSGLESLKIADTFTSRMNEIVEKQWSAEMSLSDTLLTSATEGSRESRNKAADTSSVHFLRQDSWLFAWLNRVWLSYRACCISLPNAVKFHKEFVSWIRSDDGHVDVGDEPMEVEYVKEFGSTGLPYEIESSARAKKWIKLNIHLLQVCPSACLPKPLLFKMIKSIKEHHKDLLIVHIFEMILMLSERRFQDAISALRVYFDSISFKIRDRFLNAEEVTKSDDDRIGLFDRYITVRYGPLLHARICQLMGDWDTAKQLLFASVLQAQRSDVDYKYQKPDMLCVKMAFVEMAAMEVQPLPVEILLKDKALPIRVLHPINDYEEKDVSVNDLDATAVEPSDEAAEPTTSSQGCAIRQSLLESGFFPELATSNQLNDIMESELMRLLSRDQSGESITRIFDRFSHSFFGLAPGTGGQIQSQAGTISGGTKDPSKEGRDSEEKEDAASLAILHTMFLEVVADIRFGKLKKTTSSTLNSVIGSSQGMDYGSRTRLVSDAAKALLTSIRIQQGMFESAKEEAKQLLTANCTDGIAPRHETEAYAIATANIVYAYAAQGRYEKAAEEIVNARRMFTQENNWQSCKHLDICESVVVFERSILNGDWIKCEEAVRLLRPLAREESILRNSLLMALRGNLFDARKELFEELPNYDTQMTGIIAIRIRLQLALLLAADANFELAFVHIRLAGESVFCKTHPNVYAMLLRRKAVVMLLSGDAKAARREFVKCEQEITANGTMFERALLEMGQAMSAKSLSDHAAFIKHIGQTRHLSRAACCPLLEKLALSQAAIHYDKTGQIEKRNRICDQFAILDETCPGHFRWTLF